MHETETGETDGERRTERQKNKCKKVMVRVIVGRKEETLDFSQQTCQQKTWLTFYNEQANREGEDGNTFVCSRPHRETSRGTWKQKGLEGHAVTAIMFIFMYGEGVL